MGKVKKIYRLYRKTVDKEIYSSYSGWKWDMLRSGTFRGAINEILSC